MKRKSNGCPAVVDWRHCFICQKKNKRDITNTDDTLKTVANNITEYRNLGRLDLAWNVITEVVDEEGNRTQASSLYESLKQNKACFHRVCGSKYNKQKLKRLEKKRDESEQSSSSTPSTRSSVAKKDFASYFCAICNQADLPENLHARGSIHATDQNVKAQNTTDAIESWRSMALKVGNDAMLVHLSAGGDASSNELYYHAQCNMNLWNQCIKIDKEQSSHAIEMKWRRAQAFDSIVSYVLEQETVDPGSTFVVKDLNELYVENLKSFGIEEKTQTTRFTERLLASIPNLVARTVSKNTIVLFDDKVQELVVDYVKTPDEFYNAMRKVVHPIRSDIMKQENKFTGSFNNSCQNQSVPKTLLALTSALIDGEMTSCNQPSQEALSVAQIIVSQTRRPSKRKAKLKKPTRRRHNPKQETPLLQYVGLKIFYTSRSRQLIEDLYNVGLSVSYDRVLELIKMFYEGLRRAYIEHSCFFPRILRKSIFSVWLKDNIDVNPKANFNKSSYHGTSSSIIQFRQSKDDGEEFPPAQFPEKVNRESKKLAPLPSEYTSVKNVYPAKFNTELHAPPSPDHVSPTEFPNYDSAVTEELNWLEKCEDILSELDHVYIPGWASHHASQKRGILSPSGINTILPLHRDKVSTFNMQSHLMHLNMKWTAILNPDQTPVDVSDQPVFALTKELILRFPEISS